MILSLKKRLLLPELMDDPLLPSEAHHLALNGLRRVNIISRTAQILADNIANLNRSSELIRILDVGCGGGDVTRRLAELLDARNVPCHITGWDMSPFAVKFAETTNRKYQRSIKNVTFEVRDAIAGLQDTEDGFDFIYCSLFLHHLDEATSVRLLRLMYERSSGALLVDDLVRSKLGLLLAKIGVRLLSKSAIVHYDGPQSVRAAYSIQEVHELTRAAQLPNVTLQRHWPERFILVSAKSNPQSSQIEPYAEHEAA